MLLVWLVWAKDTQGGGDLAQVYMRVIVRDNCYGQLHREMAGAV